MNWCWEGVNGLKRGNVMFCYLNWCCWRDMWYVERNFNYAESLCAMFEIDKWMVFGLQVRVMVNI